MVPSLFSPQQADLRRVRTAAMAALLIGLVSSGVILAPSAYAQQKFESRLSKLVLHQNDLFLPTRLTIGEDAQFVVKAPAGSKVAVMISGKSEGYSLNGTALRVGSDAQVLTGIVPDSGVLQLKMTMPKDFALIGKMVYIDGAAGTSEDAMQQLVLVDATGRRTGDNSLVIMKQPDHGGAAILPSMGGLTPQMFSQITQVGDIYSGKDNARKQLLDNGDVDQTRTQDQNPFTQRGLQKGIGF